MIKVKPKGATCLGMDAYHGTSDASFVNYLGKDAVKFCFHKASEGSSMVDPKLAARWPLMRATKKVIGTYHFFHPGTDPIVQANNFAKACSKLIQHGDVIFLDWESTDNVSAKRDCDNAYAWLIAVEAHFGIRPGIYSGPYFLQAVACDARFAKYTLWNAEYGVSAPWVAAPWTDWQYWQFTDAGMDQTYFNGDEAALRKFVGKV